MIIQIVKNIHLLFAVQFPFLVNKQLIKNMRPDPIFIQISFRIHIIPRVKGITVCIRVSRINIQKYDLTDKTYHYNSNVDLHLTRMKRD